MVVHAKRSWPDFAPPRAMKIKKCFHGKKTAIFAICLLVYLVGVGMFALFNGNQEKKTIIANVDKQLLLAAKGLKYMLAPDFHDRATAPDSIPLEEAIHNQLTISSYAADSGFTYLYTVIRQGDDFFFAAPTVTAEEYKERLNWYYYPYPDIPVEFVNTFGTMKPAYVSYSDQWGVFRSVALPQTTPGGKPYLSCADMNISFITTLVRGVYLRMVLHSGYFLLLTLPFSLTYLHYNRRLAQTNQNLAHHQEHLQALVESRTKELEKEKCRAETSNHLKSVFLANVSHEIRTPLNSILGFAELIQSSGAPREVVKNAAFITRSGEHLFKLVDQLLDQTRITSGQVELMVRPFQLLEFLESLVQSEMVFARKKGLELFFTMDESLPLWVDGDQFRLHQILLNLMNNAVKFTPKGSVTLDVQCEQVEQEMVWVSFSVKDTGIGIPSDKLEAIFSPFVQADNGTARIFGGTGLGTTIARQLVTLMGGRIQVENNEGMGCRFWFVIPLKKSCMPMEEDMPPAGLRLNASLPQQKVGAVLVVDDYPSNLALSRRQLECGGHKVVTADSGIKAIEWCEKQKFDLILMDINMAGMDGYKTTQILVNGNECNVPIIAMTASADNQTRERCRKAGMVDLITKPVKRFDLLEMVEKWLACPPTSSLPPLESALPVDNVFPECLTDLHCHHSTDLHQEDDISLPIYWDEALAEFEGDQELLEAVAQEFLEHLELQIDSISEAMDTDAFETIRFEAHTIKGGAGNLTAHPLARAAQAMEEAGISKKSDQCRQAFQYLCSEAGRLKSHLHQREWYIENFDC